MNYDEWIRLGERLGLKGADLAAFVKEKEADCLEREERAIRREEERRILEMQHELQLKEKEVEVERLRLARPAAEGSSRTLRPKLPRFDEVCDDMDAYIERFERYAVSQGWEEETWAMSLSSLLTGKGLEVYTSMSPEEACNYTALKTAVLKRYQLTEEGFRAKFRSGRPEAGETVHQYLSRLRRYFSRWTEMAQEDQSYQSLSDLMIREQFIQSCSSDLAMFLKERAPKTMEDLTQLAEQYVEAHGGRLASSKQSSSSAPKGKEVEHRGDKVSPNIGKVVTGRDAKTCFICKKPGHLAKDCRSKPPNRDSPWQKKERRISAICTHAEITEGPLKDNTSNGQLRLENGEALPIFSGGCTIEMIEGTRNLDLRKGFVGDREVKVLRDTGCESAAVRRDLVKPDQFLEKEIVMITVDGEGKVVPTAKIYVDTPYFEGEIEVMVPKNLICDLIIGNIPGVKDVADPEWRNMKVDNTTAVVMTRAQTKKAETPMKALQVPKPSCSREINVNALKKAQKEDKALEKLWSFAETGEMSKLSSGAEYRYEVKEGVLYRIFQKTKGTSQTEIKQVVVPIPYRRRVMELAHESIVGGHLSSQKTSDRIMTIFYWPGICGDVMRFCRSCDVCQRTIPKGRVRRVPLGQTPIIDEPFHRVAVDLIGPIIPVSESGNRYILTIVDYATRYPEAVALPRIDTERVAEAMLEVFSRVGFPSEVLSDRGSQFTSDLMSRVSRLISMKQLFTTPYNPRCNGLCERINGVLKDMLKKMCQERPKDWDRYLAAVLFAYREVTQASTGFSPFELLYGRTVRGPMQILKEMWTDEDVPETRNTYQYVLDLKHRLEETCRVAAESVRRAQETYKHHYDKKTTRRSLKVGDKVLVLLPTDKNKMMLQWKGPFEVVEKINQMDYRVKVGDRMATYHINLLKRYEERIETAAASVAIVETEDGNNTGAVDDEDLLELVTIVGKESYKDVKVSTKLPSTQRKQIFDLVKDYADIFTDQPGNTTLAEHTVELTTDTPIRQKPYSMPYAKRKDVDSEVEVMLKTGVIEPAISEYNSPIVLVRKKDGSNRFCVDFRKLNSITKFDNEPMPNVDDIMARLKDDVFFTKIDLAKGYWQIPIKEECRRLTAFSTDRGTYQFRKMPFGMVNSGATFNRMMRKLLNDCSGADSYVDDILGHTVTWDSHLKMIKDVFQRVREAGLTIRPSKCLIGFKNIGFIGHMVGNGVLQMEQDKIERIRQADVPKTKRQVRAFLGLAGYYRKFIPSFAEVASPLTDLTKKGHPNIVQWGDAQNKAFNNLKSQLSRAPILRLPDFKREFILQADASNVGLGVALLQQYEDGLFPVAFASKKLQQRERNYAVTERECLAIVFGIKKFQKYLYGKEFVIQTDHSALSYIQKSKLENGRLMRWALFLQNYRFRIEAIKGSQNFFADYLSRQNAEGTNEKKHKTDTTDGNVEINHA